jgi:hypothetical protein
LGRPVRGIDNLQGLFRFDGGEKLQPVGLSAYAVHALADLDRAGGFERGEIDHGDVIAQAVRDVRFHRAHLGGNHLAQSERRHDENGQHQPALACVHLRVSCHPE